MAVWPAALPQYFFLGVRDNRGPATIRFSADAGPGLVRKEFANPSSNVNTRVPFTKAQRIILDDFFIDDLQEGALEFDFIHNVTGLAATYRFVRPVDWESTLSKDGDFYFGSVELERLP